jgi:hypothetical protein
LHCYKRILKQGKIDWFFFFFFFFGKNDNHNDSGSDSSGERHRPEPSYGSERGVVVYNKAWSGIPPSGEENTVGAEDSNEQLRREQGQGLVEGRA